MLNCWASLRSAPAYKTTLPPPEFQPPVCWYLIGVLLWSGSLLTPTRHYRERLCYRTELVWEAGEGGFMGKINKRVALTLTFVMPMGPVSVTIPGPWPLSTAGQSGGSLRVCRDQLGRSGPPAGASIRVSILQVGGEQCLQVLRCTPPGGLFQQQGKLVAYGGETVIEQGEVALALAQAPALVAEGRAPPRPQAGGRIPLRRGASGRDRTAAAGRCRGPGICQAPCG